MDGMESYRGYGAICGYHVPARDPLSTGVQDDRVNTAQYLGVPKTRWFTIHRKFSLELLSFAQMSRGSFVIMFMSHHVGHIIISTTPHQVVGKSDSSEACAFTGEKNTLAREKLVFFSGKAAAWVAAVGSLFPGLLASVWESCRQKVHRIVAGARFAVQKCEKTDEAGAVSEDEVSKKCM